MVEPPEDANTAAAPAQESAPPPDLSPRPFHFTGSAGEYFRIWIVNLLLSIVTLGIYSAWAKVRRLRYFYGHTSVDGGTFGYHASPIAILKGRMIAYAVVITLAVAGQVAPLVSSALYLPLVMVMPIVFVRAFRFRAANSSYRGIRFGFDGMEPEAYRAFLFVPLTVPFTIGLTYPLVTKLQREYFVDNSRYGQSRFGLVLPAWPVYRIYVLAAGVALLWLGASLAIVVAMITAEGGVQAAPEEMSARAIYVGLLAYAGIAVVVVGVRTAFENLVWNHTTIDDHRFESRLGAGRMLWLYATNVLAIAGTLGLAVPWARVRMARYRAESLLLLPGGEILAAADIGGAETAAAGAELSDAMDLDFGL